MSLRVQAMAAAAVCLAIAAAAYLLAVRTGSGQVVENVAKDGRYVHRWWVEEPGAEALEASATAAVVAGAVLLVAWTAARRRSVPVLALVAVVVGGSVAAAEVLKLGLLDRPRLVTVGDPNYLAVLAPNSFPSGHTAGAAAVAMAAVLVAPAGRRAVVAAGGWAYATAVAAAMLVAEQHRPSDTVGGALLAAAVGLGAVAVAGDRIFAPGPAAEPDVRARLARGRTALAAGAAAGAVVLVALVPVLAAGVDGGTLAPDRVTPARVAGQLAAATAVAAGLAAVVAVVADREVTAATATTPLAHEVGPAAR
jgi:membrane-associated phospholipid phosphatase